MIRYTLIFICGLASGVVVYDTALERAAVSMPRASIQKPYADRPKMTNPISACDATVDGKCYIRGMR